MNVLIDTNVILDNLLERAPDTECADRIFDLCSSERLKGYVAAHSILNAYYIMRKHFPDEERRRALLDICKMVLIVGADERMIVDALKYDDFRDFEDCVVAKCAESCKADYIITRNVKDFANSSVKAITPDDFLRLRKDKTE